MSLQTPEGENALVGSSVLADHYRALGGPVGFSYYQNHRAYARLFWSLLRFLPGSAVGMEFPGWKLSLPAGVAWGELPDFDRLARAFGYGVVNSVCPKTRNTRIANCLCWKSYSNVLGEF